MNSTSVSGVLVWLLRALFFALKLFVSRYMRVKPVATVLPRCVRAWRRGHLPAGYDIKAARSFL
jgi:hypothetical protein